MGAPSLVSYSFPTDGYRLGNICDRPGCRADAVLRETSTSAIYCSETCAARHHPPMSPGYVAVAREAIALGWPTHYRRDLTLHDRCELAARVDSAGRSAPFLWVVRESGTHLMHAGPCLPGSSSAGSILRSVLVNFGGERRVYHYDGRDLRPVSEPQALAIAARWDRETSTPTRATA